MRSVLIAHRDPTVAAGLEADLHQAGYQVVGCPGPFPPTMRCIQCDTGYCPLTDGADLLIYDPTLIALDASGVECNLSVESALANPNTPVLVTTSTDAEAEMALGVTAQAPNVSPASTDRAEMLLQVGHLMANSLNVLQRPEATHTVEVAVSGRLMKTH
jgi:DNA-binding response OmpR family regulator